MRHPQVLRNPAPHAFFLSYGDSSINFELRAWTDQSSQANRSQKRFGRVRLRRGQRGGHVFPVSPA